MGDMPPHPGRAWRAIASLFAVQIASSLAGLGSVAAAQPRDSVAGRHTDLRVFRAEFLARDRSYSAAARAEAEARLRRLDSAAGSMSAIGFELELARIVALADNGHTVAIPSARAARSNRIPVRFTPFGADFHVLRADSANADLLGAKLLAIDGQPVATAIDAGRTLTGGTPAWRDRTVAYFLESPDQLHALGLVATASQASYRFERPDGGRVERPIVAEPPGPRRDNAPAGRWLYPRPLEAGSAPARALLAEERAPWAFQDLASTFRWRIAPEVDGLMIQLRANRDVAGQAIRPFLDGVLRQIRSSRPATVVLDLRMNSGGDLNTTRDFAQTLPTVTTGPIFVLTSPWTFSAGISTLGYLKQASPDRVVIVGEEIGDRLEMWSEGRLVELPFSGMAVRSSLERHDYRTGCRPYRDCHGPVIRHPIAVPTLAPDLPAPWTIEAYRAGRDPSLEAIGAWLKRRGSSPGSP
jgi:hypothetical protein